MTTELPSARELTEDLDRSRLKDFVIEHTGLTYYSNRDEDLADRVRRRLTLLGLSDCSSYLRLLKDQDAGVTEFDSLVSELTIGETYFFRHRELFDALRDRVLPDLLARRKNVGRLRIWSAGCATGPEAYSISILLKRELAHLAGGWDVNILGTDINREFLARADEGRFDEWAFRECPGDLRSDCFERAGDSWIIKPAYRQGVCFQYHNLVKHPFPSLLHNLAAFDLILCRNVMIYFGADTVQKLAVQFEHSLVEGGWLLVGHAEPNVEVFQRFRTVNTPGATLYQKCADTAPASIARIGPEISDGGSCPPVPAPPIRESSAGACAPDRKPVAEIAASWPQPDPLAQIRSFADAGDCEQAVRIATALVNTERLNPAVHFYLALVLEQMGDYLQTEQHLRQAIYLDRDFVLAHYCLGVCLQRNHDRRGAIRAFGNVTHFLSRMDPGAAMLHGDGIMAGDLRELAEMNLEVLKRHE